MVTCFAASTILCLVGQQVSEALQQEAREQAAAAEARATALQVSPYTLQLPPPLHTRPPPPPPHPAALFLGPTSTKTIK